MVARIAPSVAAALASFAREVRSRFGGRVRELVLFGSQARGEANEESDIDVLVVVDGLTEAERILVMDVAYDVNSAIEDWGGLTPLVLSTEHVADLRRCGRLLWTEIDRDGVAL